MRSVLRSRVAKGTKRPLLGNNRLEQAIPHGQTIKVQKLVLFICCIIFLIPTAVSPIKCQGKSKWVSLPPPLPRRPYFHPNPNAPWSQTFPSLCIASSIQMSHVGRTATLQAVDIHRPSERILLRGLSRGRWSCPRRSQISRSSRAPRRANPGTTRISAPILHVPSSCCVALSSS